MSDCKHLRLTNRHITLKNSEWSCTDCGAPVPYPGGCSHHFIDNETWQCKECGERMVNRADKTETVLSAPNAAPCRNPDHLAAMEAGDEFECDHPYVPDLSRQRVVPIGINVTYKCERCRYNGTTLSAGEQPIWDCGHSHRGDRIPVRAATDIVRATGWGGA